eukprot:919417-Rhodomonas_salina.4
MELNVVILVLVVDIAVLDADTLVLSGALWYRVEAAKTVSEPAPRSPASGYLLGYLLCYRHAISQCMVRACTRFLIWRVALPDEPTHLADRADADREPPERAPDAYGQVGGFLYMR